jgi:uncharacterized membrane protein YfcA
MLSEDPWFYAAAIPAVILTGISKGGLGAAGGISVPLLSLVISPLQAAALMLPILMVMDAVGLYAYRKDFDRATMAVVLPAGIAGIVIGWLTFRYLDDDWIRMLVGLVTCAFVAYNVLAGLPPPAKASRWKGYACGVVSGFTSFIAHAGGPPLAMYLLPRRLETVLYVGTTVAFFTVINALKVVPYFALGLFDARNLATSAALIPIAVAGILAGIRLRTRINITWFYRIAYTLLFATGAKLAYDGVRGLAS